MIGYFIPVYVTYNECLFESLSRALRDTEQRETGSLTVIKSTSDEVIDQVFTSTVRCLR